MSKLEIASWIRLDWTGLDWIVVTLLFVLGERNPSSGLGRCGGKMMMTMLIINKYVGKKKITWSQERRGLLSLHDISKHLLHDVLRVCFVHASYFALEIGIVSLRNASVETTKYIFIYRRIFLSVMNHVGSQFPKVNE